MDLSQFNDAPVPEKRKYETPEPAVYPVQIIRTETKPNKAGTGEFLAITFQIDGGRFSGSWVTDRLNLKNPSAKAVDIALATLKALREACGLERLGHSEDLVGHKLKIRTDTEEYNGQLYARVKEYLPLSKGPSVVNPQPGREFGNDDFPF